MKSLEFLRELKEKEVLKELSYHRISEMYASMPDASETEAELRINYSIYGTGFVPFPIIEKAVVPIANPVKDEPVAVEIAPDPIKEEVIGEVKTKPLEVKVSLLDLINNGPVETYTMEVTPQINPIEEVIEVVIEEAPVEVAPDVVEIEEDIVIVDEPITPIEEVVEDVPDILVKDEISVPNIIGCNIYANALTPNIALHTVADSVEFVKDVDTQTVNEFGVLLDADGLPIRQTSTYDNGEELPEVPGLIATGTKWDQLACDRWTTEQDMEKYFNSHAYDMPDNEVERGGFTRKCCDIVSGDPGSGKSSNLATLLALAKVHNRTHLDNDIKVSFISAEMRESEWAKELKSVPILREVHVDYMLNYVGYSNYEDIFYKCLADGDIVLVDSFPAIIAHIKMMPGEKRSEKDIITSLIRGILSSVNSNNNNVQLINQATKDGNYKGGTDLPHMMSSMSFIRIKDGQRHWNYTKNRNNGNVGRKLFFGRDDNNIIEFDEEAYKLTYESEKDRKVSMEELLASLEADEGFDPEATTVERAAPLTVDTDDMDETNAALADVEEQKRLVKVAEAEEAASVQALIDGGSTINDHAYIPGKLDKIDEGDNEVPSSEEE